MAGSDVSDVSLDNLYQAILQCFVIILSGYIAGRVGVLTATQSSGIGTFVSKICLPALLFKSMCELQFSEVNWSFLCGLLIAKSIIFAVIAVCTLLVKRPINLGYAGLFAIFGTQSNDFALGYPIVQALYGSTHPEYTKYIYLAMPISLVVLNPIGFMMMEIHRHRSVQESQPSGMGKAVMHVFRGVLLNPIVFMTAIGVVGNFVFSGKVPGVLDGILTVVGQAFNASALFYLGLSMVGKVQQPGIGLIVPILLITAKTLLLPLITWETVGWLEPEVNNTSFSMYGFLYGTFPTAPSVFLYASDYGIAQDIIATGLVLGTLLSAPLMFVSAKMMSLMVVTGMDYKDVLLSTSFDISIISLICCLWVTGVFIANGKWKRVPHRFTMAWILSHMVACIGMIAFDAHQGMDWGQYPITIILLLGVFATRCWTAVIALVMCLLQVGSLCFVLRHQFWFFFAGFGFPVFMTGVLFIVGAHNFENDVDPSFHYGSMQTAFSLAILLVSIIVTITSLVVWQRSARHLVDYKHLPEESDLIQAGDGTLAGSTAPLEYDQLDRSIDPIAATGQIQATNGLASGDSRSIGSRPARRSIFTVSTSIEDLVPSRMISGNEAHGSSMMENLSERTCLVGRCSIEQRHECMDRLRTYTADALMEVDSPEEEGARTMSEITSEEYQTAHHLILLLVCLLSMFIGLFLCAWRLFQSQASGIYVEIEFLDSVFNYGQGFFLLTVFGFDTRLVFSPLVRRLRRLLFGAEVLHLPKPSELDANTRHTCQQFRDYHEESCCREIVKDRRSRFSMFKKVFTGTTLCDWLIRVGLAEDREAAVAYGRRLILGRVITHVNSEHHFHDARYFYRFLELEYIGI